MSGPNDERMGDILADAKEQRANYMAMLAKVQLDGVRPGSPMSAEETIVQITQEIVQLDWLIKHYGWRS
ncbi:hypothetical protein MKK88_27770 [Methylobacterium sp. E-005]|uniref:hypothetical protein n=1 Tax=Methylobacterium sp. E-005 TaxID=2836549 RepID=UPI001FBAE16B|nr:hypothetical protein [Methylobacterium sp. E-005]MCJ2089757.1 hypothetical protein [Methylobacterium sp. E-005]